MYKSTAKALPWLDCGDHDDGRKVIPSVHLEAMVRKATVSKPEELRPRAPQLMTWTSC